MADETIITVAELKKTYEPKEAGTGGQVCVGGIFIAEWMRRKGYEFKIGEDLYTFPGGEILSRYLREYNPKLSKQKANEIASRIISNNDNGNFCDSWDALDEGLSFGQPKKAAKKKAVENKQYSIEDYLDKQDRVEEFLNDLDASMKEAEIAPVGALPETPAEHRKKRKQAEQQMLSYRRPGKHVRSYRRGGY